MFKQFKGSMVNYYGSLITCLSNYEKIPLVSELWKEAIIGVIESIGNGSYSYEKYCERCYILDQNDNSVIKFEAEYWLPLISMLAKYALKSDIHYDFVLLKLSDILECKKLNKQTMFTICQKIVIPQIEELPSEKCDYDALKLAKLLSVTSQTLFKYKEMQPLIEKYIKALFLYIPIFSTDKKNAGVEIIEECLKTYGSSLSNDIWATVIEQISKEITGIVKALSLNEKNKIKNMLITIISLQKCIGTIFATHKLPYELTIQISICLEKSASVPMISEEAELVMLIEKTRLNEYIRLFNMLRTQVNHERSVCVERFYEY